jgi:hypothetical protein
MSVKRPRDTMTLTFDQFWSWLEAHPNCIIRAGTPEVLLMDDEDFHWHFSTEEDGTQLVQVLRGKKLVGEIALVSTEVSYVQVEPGEGDEVKFSLISEAESERLAAYTFVLSHGYDKDEAVTPGRWTH